MNKKIIQSAHTNIRPNPELRRLEKLVAQERQLRAELELACWPAALRQTGDDHVTTL